MANAIGWGAYFGLATRRPGLTRWQRGDMKTLVEVPALIADIDESPNVALPRVRAFPIPPSCIVSSGHGLHIYWLLDEPTTDMQAVNAIHRGLVEHLKGDYLAAATALRLPGSLNTKHNTIAHCEVLESDWLRRYVLSDFASFRPQPSRQITSGQLNHRSSESKSSLPVMPNPAWIEAVVKVLLSQGFKWRETWLNGPCPHAHLHKHMDGRPSFGFNTVTGYGYCFVCGSTLLKDLFAEFCIDPQNVGELACKTKRG